MIEALLVVVVVGCVIGMGIGLSFEAVRELTTTSRSSRKKKRVGGNTKNRARCS